MEICFLIYNWSNTGGTERVSTSIANSLSQEVDSVHFLSVYGEGEASFALNDKIVKKQFFDVKDQGKLQTLEAIFKIRSYISRNKISRLILVETMVSIIGLPAIMGLNCRSIVWEHFNYSIDLNLRGRRIARKLAKYAADDIVVLTKRDKELWEAANTKSDKLIVISNPIPCTVLEGKPKSSGKLIIAVGRLTYQKGFDLLVDAFKDVAHAYSDWTLKIIGSGEDEELLKKKIHAYGLNHQIQLVPNTKNVLQFYREASFLVMSSRFEGLPMVLLESIANALPVISFDCLTGPSEIIDHNKNGLLVANGNTAELAKAIIDLIENPELLESMSAHCLNKTQEFHLDNVIHKWINLLK